MDEDEFDDFQGYSQVKPQLLGQSKNQTQDIPNQQQPLNLTPQNKVNSLQQGINSNGNLHQGLGYNSNQQYALYNMNAQNYKPIQSHIIHQQQLNANVYPMQNNTYNLGNISSISNGNTRAPQTNQKSVNNQTQLDNKNGNLYAQQQLNQGLNNVQTHIQHVNQPNHTQQTQSNWYPQTSQIQNQYQRQALNQPQSQQNNWSQNMYNQASQQQQNNAQDFQHQQKLHQQQKEKERQQQIEMEKKQKQWDGKTQLPEDLFSAPLQTNQPVHQFQANQNLNNQQHQQQALPQAQQVNQNNNSTQNYSKSIDQNSFQEFQIAQSPQKDSSKTPYSIYRITSLNKQNQQPQTQGDDIFSQFQMVNNDIQNSHNTVSSDKDQGANLGSISTFPESGPNLNVSNFGQQQGNQQKPLDPLFPSLQKLAANNNGYQQNDNIQQALKAEDSFSEFKSAANKSAVQQSQGYQYRQQPLDNFQEYTNNNDNKTGNKFNNQKSDKQIVRPNLLWQDSLAKQKQSKPLKQGSFSKHQIDQDSISSVPNLTQQDVISQSQPQLLSQEELFFQGAMPLGSKTQKQQQKVPLTVSKDQQILDIPLADSKQNNLGKVSSDLVEASNKLDLDPKFSAGKSQSSNNENQVFGKQLRDKQQVEDLQKQLYQNFLTDLDTYSTGKQPQQQRQQESNQSQINPDNSVSKSQQMQPNQILQPTTPTHLLADPKVSAQNAQKAENNQQLQEKYDLDLLGISNNKAQTTQISNKIPNLDTNQLPQLNTVFVQSPELENQFKKANQVQGGKLKSEISIDSSPFQSSHNSSHLEEDFGEFAKASSSDNKKIKKHGTLKLKHRDSFKIQNNFLQQKSQEMENLANEIGNTLTIKGVKPKDSLESIIDIHYRSNKEFSEFISAMDENAKDIKRSVDEIISVTEQENEFQDIFNEEVDTLQNSMPTLIEKASRYAANQDSLKKQSLNSQLSKLKMSLKKSELLNEQAQEVVEQASESEIQRDQLSQIQRAMLDHKSRNQSIVGNRNLDYLFAPEDKIRDLLSGSFQDENMANTQQNKPSPFSPENKAQSPINLLDNFTNNQQNQAQTNEIFQSKKRDQVNSENLGKDSQQQLKPFNLLDMLDNSPAAIRPAVQPLQEQRKPNLQVEQQQNSFDLLNQLDQSQISDIGKQVRDSNKENFGTLFKEAASIQQHQPTQQPQITQSNQQQDDDEWDEEYSGFVTSKSKDLNGSENNNSQQQNLTQTNDQQESISGRKGIDTIYINQVQDQMSKQYSNKTLAQQDKQYNKQTQQVFYDNSQGSINQSSARQELDLDFLINGSQKGPVIESKFADNSQKSNASTQNVQQPQLQKSPTIEKENPFAQLRQSQLARKSQGKRGSDLLDFDQPSQNLNQLPTTGNATTNTSELHAFINDQYDIKQTHKVQNKQDFNSEASQQSYIDNNKAIGLNQVIPPQSQQTSHQQQQSSQKQKGNDQAFTLAQLSSPQQLFSVSVRGPQFPRQLFEVTQCWLKLLETSSICLEQYRDIMNNVLESTNPQQLKILFELDLQHSTTIIESMESICNIFFGYNVIVSLILELLPSEIFQKPVQSKIMNLIKSANKAWEGSIISEQGQSQINNQATIRESQKTSPGIQDYVLAVSQIVSVEQQNKRDRWSIINWRDVCESVKKEINLLGKISTNHGRFRQSQNSNSNMLQCSISKHIESIRSASLRIRQDIGIITKTQTIQVGTSSIFVPKHGKFKCSMTFIDLKHLGDIPQQSLNYQRRVVVPMANMWLGLVDDKLPSFMFDDF